MNNSSIISVKGKGVRPWFWYVLIGIFFIFSALLALFDPPDFYVALGFVFGLSLLASGVIQTAMSIYESSRENHFFGWEFAIGIMNLIIGGVLLSRAALATEVFVIYVGFSMLLNAVFVSLYAREIHKIKNGSWLGLFILSLIGICLAILIMVDPVIGGITIVGWGVFVLFVLGFSNVAIGLKLKSLNQAS